MGDLKREHGGGESPLGKRARGEEEEMTLKVLVPTSVAGAIIGKGGETLRQLQSQTGARMKMSKNNENYPETTERVAQLSGGIAACVAALKFIHDKVGLKLDRGCPPDPYDFKNTDRAREVSGWTRILELSSVLVWGWFLGSGSGRGGRKRKRPVCEGF